jgi:hypothetical protein
LLLSPTKPNSPISGGCSNVVAEPSGENMDLTFNHKTLCPGQIAGIVLGSVIAAGVAVAGVGALAFGLPAGADTGDYVSL